MKLDSSVKLSVGLVVLACWGSMPGFAQSTEGPEVPAVFEVELGLLRGLSQVPGVVAKFREEKQTALLAEPLTLEGTIWIAPPGVLLRETADPPSRLLIAERRVILIDEEGRSEFSLRDRAPAAAVGRFFFEVRDR